MIQVTEKANNYLNKKISAENALGLRLSVKKTGCSGFAYVPTIVTEQNDKDICYEISNLKIFIDVMWAHVLDQLTIDYIEEEKSGLKQKRLLFINPNESARCGCGESFHIDTQK